MNEPRQTSQTEMNNGNVWYRLPTNHRRSIMKTNINTGIQGGLDTLYRGSNWGGMACYAKSYAPLATVVGVHSHTRDVNRGEYLTADFLQYFNITFTLTTLNFFSQLCL